MFSYRVPDCSARAYCSSFLGAFPLHVQQSRPRTRRISSTTFAALYVLPESITEGLHTGATLGITLSLFLSSLPLLTGESKSRNANRFLQPSLEEDTDSIKWSVMGVLSFLPFLHPLAWIFAALDDEDSSTVYYSFAFLYALPYIANGLQFDSPAALAMIVGIAHVQLERIAQTEPVEIALPSLIKGLLKLIPGAFRTATKYGSSLGDEVASRTTTKKQGDGVGRLTEKTNEGRMRLDEDEVSEKESRTEDR